MLGASVLTHISVPHATMMAHMRDTYSRESLRSLHVDCSDLYPQLPLRIGY